MDCLMVPTLNESINTEIHTSTTDFDEAIGELYSYLQQWRDWEVQSMMVTRPKIPGKPSGKFNIMLTLERRQPHEDYAGANKRATRNLGD